MHKILLVLLAAGVTVTVISSYAFGLYLPVAVTATLMGVVIGLAAWSAILYTRNRRARVGQARNELVMLVVSLILGFGFAATIMPILPKVSRLAMIGAAVATTAFCVLRAAPRLSSALVTLTGMCAASRGFSRLVASRSTS